MRQASQAAAVPDEAAAAFDSAVALLRAGQEQVRALRPELSFEDIPAPRSLAPYAAAVAAAVRCGEEEVASGRFVVLYDPAGQPGWQGPLRVIAIIQADMEPEIASDPLVGQVAWSWLTEALDAGAAGYAAPSGTVTRVVTEGFGGKQDEPAESSVELRASWSPAAGPGGEAAPDPATAGLADHLAAWCGALCAASGLPPLAAGVAPLRPPARRRGP